MSRQTGTKLAGGGIQLTGLRVNGHSRPLGIDSRSIRFSWQLGPARDIAVAAARIWMGSAAENLGTGGSGEEVWDSGWQEGACGWIDYSGPELAGNRRYWWKLAVRDAEGHIAESELSSFDTGLFPGEWRAEWIWGVRKPRINDFVYFRKDFAVRKRVAFAKLYVSAHNTAHVYIDGVKIGGYGSPAPSNPAVCKYYNAYDVTDRLTAGKRCIAAVAHYLGGSGQNYVNALPGFRLQLEIEYTDGERETLATDRTWHVLKEPPHHIGTPYQQKRRISAMEDYAADRLDPKWCLPGFDRKACKYAVPARIGKNEWPMKWQEIAEGIIEEEIVPHEVTPSGEAGQHELPEAGHGLRQVFDAGKIVSGWVKIKLKGVPGVTVRMRYSEALDERGYVMHNVCNEKSETYYDQYRMRGDESETWQPDLSYKAFRYVEISGYPEPIVPGVHLWVISAHTELGQQGRFRCSSELLNKMAEACLQTQKNNVLGQTVDCPHREQAQYLADSDLQAETLAYNFESRHVLEKVLSDFAAGQKEDGTFPFVYPTNPEHPNFRLQIPEWDLHYCTLMWKLYWMTGDERVLMRYLPAAKRMADYFAGLADRNEYGLVPLDRGWHISDWPYPTVEHSSDYLTVQNIKLYRALRVIADAAGVLGRIDDQKRYAERAERLKENIRDHLFDRNRRRFRDCLGSEKTHQGVNALALYEGIVPEPDREALIDYVANKPWESKTVLSLPLLRMLFENGREEAAYRLIDREAYPGWGHMIVQGAKTMWEGWDDIASHCHAWNSYPLRLLQEYVAGVRAAKPGFAEALIKPYMPERLRFAEATVLTERGAIRVKWEKAGSATAEALDGRVLLYRVIMELPAGMRTRLVLREGLEVRQFLLMESGVPVWEDGKHIPGQAGIENCAISASGELVAVLSGGRFEFSAYAAADS